MRFDADFAAKMVADAQAAVDQTQKAQALARAPGMAPMLAEIAPGAGAAAGRRDGAGRRAADAAQSATMPFWPAGGLGRMPTGIDTSPGVAPRSARRVQPAATAAA